ncbi:SspB family protein [Microvirga alba]|uniref:Stringent starvation protein B n=1 Tax=Microvirga alba TaxID=2791025 RepID=A0A931BM13_9HYPH|nr:ClpXP protease specificity-enhancing factor SspB [Microvirga alba]MBF9233562.1 Stringent starvation protein B [Microvirga alba]
MAGKDLIRYDLLVQDALKGVVRKVLIDAGKDGLPGDHHFYVSFRTDFPGVRLSNRLREKYPQEMTIVLQHQFWDLGVTEHNFEIGLSFSGVPERLLVPFDALTGFFDPSVQFGLKFDGQDENEGEAGEAPPAPQPVRSNGSEPVELKQSRKSSASADKTPDAKKTVAPAAQADADRSGAEETTKPGAAEPTPSGSAEVVSLDSFRKKN